VYCKVCADTQERYLKPLRAAAKRAERAKRMAAGKCMYSACKRKPVPGRRGCKTCLAAKAEAERNRLDKKRGLVPPLPKLRVDEFMGGEHPLA